MNQFINIKKKKKKKFFNSNNKHISYEIIFKKLKITYKKISPLYFIINDNNIQGLISYKK